MEQQLRKYPVGIQTFSEIRENEFVYVDKTALIYRLVTQGKYYFLGRPRRFGKSLLISTLAAYFEGRKELFDGLAISEYEKDWISYPVFRFDFSTGKFATKEDLETAVDYKLSEYEKLYGLDKEQWTINVRMTRLVKKAYEQTSRQVVILIDEYDSAMLYHVDDDIRQDEVRLIMRNLFSPIKELDPLLKFVFFTGITKFSQMSVFSELNNLENISMQSEYDALCGISEEELTTQLRQDMELLAQSFQLTYDEMHAELKRMYDGYHFSKKKNDIYNPYSLLNAFKKKDLSNYWFGTATPSFLIKVLKRYQMEISDVDGIKCDETGFDRPVEHIDDPIPVLYQSGYLTIKDYENDLGIYTLGFPNLEVRKGFARSLFEYVAPSCQRNRNSLFLSYADFYRSDNIEPFLQALCTFFAAYPYSLNNNNERHYQAILFTVLTSFGADVRAEQQTANGRIDLVLCMPKTIYVIELKYGRSADEAMQQVVRKDYAAALANDARKVVCLAINFSKDERTLIEWEVKKV